MSTSLQSGQSASGASILVVGDEPDVADLFRQGFRREARQGTYVLHFAASGAEALDRLAREVQPTLLAVLSDINMPGARPGVAGRDQTALPRSARQGCETIEQSIAKHLQSAMISWANTPY
jgi:CheY-like chemotaxis protein